jgi:P4 family phage/plasmid primase-like protien
MTSLQTFLNSHRVEKGAEWNLTGIGSDLGSYFVPPEEYETFLALHRTRVFINKQPSYMLEKHMDGKGPLIVDLDLRHPAGVPLERRFTTEHQHQFIEAYASALARFVDISQLPTDLSFYVLTKPGPEHAADHHKDGIHIQCPSITVTPELQYVIRGYLLEQKVIETIFADTELTNDATDCYDVSVIHRNNWFFYGAGKPNKSQYKIQEVITIPRDSLKDVSVAEIPDKIVLEEDAIPINTLEITKLLSIRRNHDVLTPLVMHEETAAEYRKLVTAWGQGKAVPSKVSTPLILPSTLRHETVSDGGSESLVGVPANEDEIARAYRLVKECLNAEKRCGEYHDWINMAICLKNISDTEESFLAWCDITRRVDPHHKKATFSDIELKAKWVKVSAGRHDHPIRIATLNYWAKQDNPEVYDAILSENIRDWIIANGTDTHVNVATVVHKLYQDEFVCSIGMKRGAQEWFQYVGHSWRHLRSSFELRTRLSSSKGVWGQYMKADRYISDIMMTCKETEREGWESKRKYIGKIRVKLENTAFKDAVLKECGEKFMKEEFISTVNTNPRLIGVVNGVLELRPAVVFRPGRPEDNITFIMGRSASDPDGIPYIPYDPEHPTPEHLQVFNFFKDIYPDDDLRRYVLLKESACLEGLNREQKMWIESGRGSNGKSKKQELMHMTFGDYSTAFSPTVLTRSRADGGSANPELIVLRGKRYAYTSEPDIGEKIKTAIVKAVSGGEPLTVRALYSDQESIKVTFRISMSANDLPAVDSTDEGALRRWAVIPHIALFVDAHKPIDPKNHIHHKDLDLEEKMKEWRVAFLGILVHYYKIYLDEKELVEPELVKQATNKYKLDNDSFSAFANDTLVVEAGAGPIRMSDVVLKYKEWKRTSGMLDIKKGVLLERMKNIAAKGSTDVEFKGVRFKEEGEEDRPALSSSLSIL